MIVIKPLEIPYNFDKDLITFLKIYFKDADSMVHSIYFPPYKEDYMAAKNFLPQERSNKLTYETYPTTYKDYVSHIEWIEENFPGRAMLLLQKNNTLLQSCEKYVKDLNIQNYCVGSIEQAAQLKQINPNVEITGSITMKLSYDDLTNFKKYKDFENIVLFFPYNRDLELIKKLPPYFKYILLVNCGCHIECPGVHHWFADTAQKEIDTYYYCPGKNNPNVKFSMIIRPMDLEYFDPYISYYKIQGRECQTSTIITDIVNYTTPWNNKYPLINHYPNLYYKDKII